MRLTQKAAIFLNLMYMHNVAKTQYVADNLGLQYTSLSPCDSFQSILVPNYQNHFRIIALNITHPSGSVSTVGTPVRKSISLKYFYMHRYVVALFNIYALFTVQYTTVCFLVFYGVLHVSKIFICSTTAVTLVFLSQCSIRLCCGGQGPDCTDSVICTVT